MIHRFSRARSLKFVSIQSSRCPDRARLFVTNWRTSQRRMKPENRHPGCAGATARSEAILSAGLSLCRCREIAADRPSARLATPAQGEKRIPPRSITRRCLDAVAWIAPGVTLILLPKCPACLAAYVALLGVGISMTTSLYLRTTLMIVCVGSLLFLTIKSLCARARRQLSIDPRRDMSPSLSPPDDWVHRITSGARARILPRKQR